MTRWFALLATLLLATPLFAIDDGDRAPRTDRNRRTVVVVADVIRMAAAGVSDDAIIAYVHNTRDDFDVTADDIIAMTDAHVSNDVVKAVVDGAAARKDRRGTGQRSYYAAAAPYPYYYDPYYYPGYYYDPFWYAPRVSFGFGFGPRFGGGGFRGRHR